MTGHEAYGIPRSTKATLLSGSLIMCMFLQDDRLGGVSSEINFIEGRRNIVMAR